MPLDDRRQLYIRRYIEAAGALDPERLANATSTSTMEKLIPSLREVSREFAKSKGQELTAEQEGELMAEYIAMVRKDGKYAKIGEVELAWAHHKHLSIDAWSESKNDRIKSPFLFFLFFVFLFPFSFFSDEKMLV